MTEDKMPEDPVHSRPSPRPPMPDAHGQAALLLAESTLHVLLEARILTLDQVIGVVTTAAEVKVEVAEELGESFARMEQSLDLLTAIKASFYSDTEYPDLHVV